MPAYVRTTIRLAPDLAQAVDARSKRDRKRRSDIIEAALRAYLADELRISGMTSEIADRARSLGLFDSGIVTALDESPSSRSRTENDAAGRVTLPFLFLGHPVVIDPSAPPLELDADGYPLLPGGYYANYCDACGESYMKHDDGECPEKEEGE